jgi:hypothetical protein
MRWWHTLHIRDAAARIALARRDCEPGLAHAEFEVARACASVEPTGGSARGGSPRGAVFPACSLPAIPAVDFVASQSASASSRSISFFGPWTGIGPPAVAVRLKTATRLMPRCRAYAACERNGTALTEPLTLSRPSR